MRVPVCVTVDNMGLAADVGRGLATEPDPNEPGLAIGIPAIVDVLTRHDASVTFFLEGWNGEHHADRVRELVELGHEIGCHGWVHETWRQLDQTTERDLLERALASLRGCGADVRGFRAPGGARADTTLDTLRELGLGYDASLDEGDARDDDGVVVLPFRWRHVDWHWFGELDPPAPAERFASELNEGLDEALTTGLPLVVIVHPRTTGLHADRLATLDQFVRIVGDDDRFELTTMSAAASFVTQR